MKSIGFVQSKYDPALFSRRGSRGVIFISSHVDDYLITGSDGEGIRDLKVAMAGRFKMKEIGATTSYLGMEIVREAGSIRLCQARYTMQLLKDAGM